MNYKRILLVSFLILSSFVVWTAYASSTEETSLDLDINLATDSFLNLDYIEEDSVFRQELVDVKDKINKQYQQAEMIAMSLKFEDGLNYDYLTNYTYVFDSPSFENKYLVVNNPRIRSEVEEALADEDLFNDMPKAKIKEEYLKINFVQALEIVEKFGGYNFRADRYGKYSVSMLLSQSDGGILNWQISYFDKTDNTEQNWIVNAATGKV